jgi:hypothetical protein
MEKTIRSLLFAKFFHYLIRKAQNKADSIEVNKTKGLTERPMLKGA